MRPDRIVVGEVRGAEVLDMLQAANTGHRGLLTTLHAGSPAEVPARLEAMALTAPGAVLGVVRRLIAGGIGAVVHLERGPAGRRVAALAELVAAGAGQAVAVPLRTAGPRPGLCATGRVPCWAERLDPSVLHLFEPATPPAASASCARGAGDEDEQDRWWFRTGRVGMTAPLVVLALLVAAALLAAFAAVPPETGALAAAPPGIGRASGPAPGRHPAGAGRPGGPRAGLDRLAARLPVPGRAARHRRELEAAVPEVLDVLRATIAAGIAPHMALRAAAEGAPPPLAGPLGEAVRLTGIGSGAGRALATAAGAAGLRELLVAGEALDLAETTGAPPGPVLAGVAAAAADRVRARQARMAATAQARLSARVVGAMAPAFLAVLAVTSPSDAAFLVRDPLGWAALTAAVAFEAAGIHWSARIVGSPTP
jgi:hypothetical protein